MLAPWKKSCDKPRQHNKSRDMTLPTKVGLVKAMVSPAVMYGCENWTMEKVEHWRTDAFDLWCWRRLLRVPWTAKRSNQLIIKEINLSIYWKDWCWSWSSNTLATWWEDHLATGKDPDAGKDWRQVEKGTAEDEMVGWHHRVNGHEYQQAPRVGDGQGSLACCSPQGCKESDTTEWLNWIELNWYTQLYMCACCVTSVMSGFLQC